jgi:uracil-DNA glycosylase
MDVSDHVACVSFACTDVEHDRYTMPGLVRSPDDVTILMVSEAPTEPGLAERTTVQAFRDAGEEVESLRDVRRLGVYLTTAVKCGKAGPAISTPTICACSALLEQELGLFPLARALMLMGDTAIRVVHEIAKRNGEPRPVPAGATYRLRGGEFWFRGLKVFPSYVQAGPAFFVETSKRRMIAEDIAAALAYVRG